MHDSSFWAVLAAALALVRLAVTQHRSMADRFVSYLESAANRHREVLENLTRVVEDNTALLQRIAERLP